jgi:hypothetical protein
LTSKETQEIEPTTIWYPFELEEDPEIRTRHTLGEENQ